MLSVRGRQHRRGATAPPWLLVCASVVCGAAGTADGADWTIQPRLNVAETWSDNVNLSGTDPESDFVTQITPGVNVRGTGGRVTLDLDYQLGLVHYLQGNGSQRFDNRLQANGNVEVLQQLFFVDFSSTAGQQNTSSTGTPSLDGVSSNSNRSNFFTYAVNPYLVHHFGAYADGRVSYEHAAVKNSGSASDSTIDGVSASFTSGRAFSVLPWTLDAETTRTSYDPGRDSTTRSVDASLSYAFNRLYKLRVNGGYENNDLAVSTGDTSGPTWRVTGIWTPSPRTDVELGYGRRWFGNSISFDARHRTRRAVFSASYFEDSTTTASQQLDTQLVQFEDPFGNPIENPGLDPILIPIGTSTLTDQVLITRRFDGGATLRLHRGTASLGVYHERRNYGLTGDDETVYGANANLTHRLNAQTSASLLGIWQRSDFGDQQGKDTLWRVDLSLSRRIYPDINGSFGYTYSKNDSTTAASDYTENRVSARVTVLF